MSALTVNRPPSITWHKLRMNETRVEIPDLDSADSAAISITLPQQVLEAPANQAASAFSAACAALDIAGWTISGTGAQTSAWLQGQATRHLTVEVPAQSEVPGPLVIRLHGVAGKRTILALDVIAHADSHLDIVVETDGDETEKPSIAATLVRICAEEGAQIRLQKVQTLQGTWTYFDETALCLGPLAHIDVEQTVLGAERSLVGLAAELAGHRSQCRVDTHYLGRANMNLDFNYLMRLRGSNAKGTLEANGVLSGASSKILRGTIDFVHGCKGSIGRETETVLLTDDQVRNKTLPVILCDEDDVQGDHGATIGHVNPEQRRYLQARGLSLDQIEALFAQAVLDHARDHAFDDESRRAIDRLAHRASRVDLVDNPYKRDFPLLANNPELAFLDTAATAQRPICVLDAQRNFYERMNSNPLRGLYRLSVEATEAIEQVREKVAAFIGAPSPEEIIFTRNTSESLNLMAHSYGDAVLHEGDEVCISIMEHHSNLIPWQQACMRAGARLVYLRPDQEGFLSEEEIETKITPRTRIVSITQISNVLGVLAPIERIAQRAHEVGAILIVDGAQSAPHIPIDVKDLGCDAFAFSAHKLFGPMGIGVLWARREILEQMPPLLTGGEMIDWVTEEDAGWAPLPQRFEAGTQDAAGIAGLGAAIDYIENVGHAALQARESALVEELAQRLQALPFVELIGPHDPHKRIGVVSFNVQGIHPHDVASILDMQNVAIRAGHHCAQPLLAWLGMESCCRTSVALYNDEKDIDQLIDGLETVWETFHETR